jgi:hypothetical protein
MPNITTLPGKKTLNFLENLMAWMVLGFEFSRFFFSFFSFSAVSERKAFVEPEEKFENRVKQG